MVLLLKIFSLFLLEMKRLFLGICFLGSNNNDNVIVVFYFGWFYCRLFC